MHHLDDKDLLNLLQIILRNGNLFSLINPNSHFQYYEDVDRGIKLLIDKKILELSDQSYHITDYGFQWRIQVWRQFRIKGIYRYIIPHPSSLGLNTSFDDPFLPKKI